MIRDTGFGVSLDVIQGREGTDLYLQNHFVNGDKEKIEYD